jgi:hypothetical protein
MCFCDYRNIPLYERKLKARGSEKSHSVSSCMEGPCAYNKPDKHIAGYTLFHLGAFEGRGSDECGGYSG